MKHDLSLVMVKYWCSEPLHRNRRRFLGEHIVPQETALAIEVYPPVIICPSCGQKRVAQVSIAGRVETSARQID